MRRTGVSRNQIIHWQVMMRGKSTTHHLAGPEYMFLAVRKCRRTGRDRCVVMLPRIILSAWNTGAGQTETAGAPSKCMCGKCTTH